MSANDAYKAAGVNIAAGDAFSQYWYKRSRETFENCPLIRVEDWSQGNFRGPRVFEPNPDRTPKGTKLTAAMDGNGTKVILTAEANNHRSAYDDTFAMDKLDVERYGGVAVIFLSELSVNSLGEVGSTEFCLFQAMVDGAVRSANNEQLIILGGETAEMGVCVESENKSAKTKFQIAGTIIGLVHPGKMITGETLRSGQAVMALREPDGIRANGGSLGRRGLRKRFGDQYWVNLEARKSILRMATPSKLYQNFFPTLNGWFDENFEPMIKVHAIAHLTGGSIKGKFAEMLFRHGLSAILDDLYEPSQIQLDCAEWLGLEDWQALAAYNGGQGTLAVIDESDVNFFAEVATTHGVEAKKCGEIRQKRDGDSAYVTVKSKFQNRENIVYFSDGSTHSNGKQVDPELK